MLSVVLVDVDVWGVEGGGGVVEARRWAMARAVWIRFWRSRVVVVVVEDDSWFREMLAVVVVGVDDGVVGGGCDGTVSADDEERIGALVSIVPFGITVG